MHCRNRHLIRPNMDEATGRGHRQKIPTDKVKEHVGGKIEKMEDERPVILPTYIAPNDTKFLSDQKELGKIYDHSKLGSNGERIDFFQLGTHVESKEKRYYIRAKRDDHSLLFPRRRGPSSLRKAERRESSAMCASKG